MEDFELDFDTPMEDMVFMTTPFNNNKANNKIGSFDIIRENTSVNSQLNIFALDTAATKHICYNLAYFSDFKACNKTVNWGQAKQIQIKRFGNIFIKSNTNN